jgi:hypothetical protein
MKLDKPSPSAIQTEFGWADPDTGELLVSLRNLPNPVRGFTLGHPWKKPDKYHADATEQSKKKNARVETEAPPIKEFKVKKKADIVNEIPQKDAPSGTPSATPSSTPSGTDVKVKQVKKPSGPVTPPAK